MSRRSRRKDNGWWVTLKIMLGFAFLGFLIASRVLVFFLNSLPPLHGLIVMYLIFMAIIAFAVGGETLFGRKIRFKEVLALSIIAFTLNIYADFSSQWVWLAEGKQPEVPNIVLQSPDGVIFYYSYDFYSKYRNIFSFTSPETLAAYTTYVIAPVVLIFIASILLKSERKIKEAFARGV